MIRQLVSYLRSRIGSRSLWPLTLAMLALVGCRDNKPCVDRSKAALEACSSRSEQLQSELDTLKKKLAQALANPGTLHVDPSVMVIHGKKGGSGIRVKEGTISQDEVVRVLRQNKTSLRPCYTRALKRDSALHHRKLVLTLAMKVKPAGMPAGVALGPNYDDQMIDCMKKAVRRWRFPTFEGTPVGVETPLTFQPKK